jgi:calpain
MEFCSFYCFFNSIIESKNLYNFKSVPDGLGNPIAPSLSVHIISGEWNGMTSAGRDGMHLNPQYQIFSPVTKGCVLTVHLEQPSRRMNMLMEYPFYVAPVVLKNGEARQRKLDLAQDAVATGTFISNRSCLLEALLENPDTSKPYVVIPATYEGNLPRTSFYLTLFTSKPTAIIPISDTASLPICCVCQRPLVGTFRTFTHANGVDRVCKDTCVQIYRERNTPVCVECGLGIEPIEGRFSGRMFTLPDGTSVHAECIDAYRVRIADKCQHCGHAITPIPGKFDGKYFETPNGKCHSECMEAYQMSTSKRCLHCREPIMKITGRFDGRFYKVSGTIDEQVHFECWDSYQLSMAPKCVHCFEPIMKVPQKFDGRFYELSDGSGKVHFECWESFRVLRS